MRNVGRWRHKVEILLVELVAVQLVVRKRCAVGRRCTGIVRQDDGFRLYAQALMFGQHVELMHPVAVRVAIRRAARVGIRGQAERETALPLVVHWTETHFVIAFRNRTVIDEVRRMQQAISIHATTA